jgi:hypothetical protein
LTRAETDAEESAPHIAPAKSTKTTFDKTAFDFFMLYMPSDLTTCKRIEKRGWKTTNLGDYTVTCKCTTAHNTFKNTIDIELEDTLKSKV